LSIDDEDIPDIDDVIDEPIEPDEPDDDEDEEIEKMGKQLQKYIKQHKITPKTYTKRKHKAIKDLKKQLELVDLLLLSEAYMKNETYSGFIRKHEELRKGFLKALLAHLDVDAQKYVLSELLDDLCGDEEPVEHYIW